MSDIHDPVEPTETGGPARRSISLTNPVLALAAAVVALAAFLLGYVVKEIGHHGRPPMAHAMRNGVGPGAGGPGAGGPAAGGPLGSQGANGQRPSAGTFESISGNTITLKTPDGKTAKVKLGKTSFVVVQKAATQR